MRLIICQHEGNGEEKIAGIRRHGRDLEIYQVIDLKGPLPDFIDDPADYLPCAVDGDLLLCFVRHPDICDFLAAECRRLGIPMIASGTKTRDAHTPFTCCGLGRVAGLGAYGEQFGVPEFEVRLEDGVIREVSVRRGASCGATWIAAAKIVGKTLEEARPLLAREVQYLCAADPSAFDPVSGKSALHYAGHVHIAALNKAAMRDEP